MQLNQYNNYEVLFVITIVCAGIISESSSLCYINYYQCYSLDQTVSDESIVDNVDTTNFDKKTKLKIDALENELKLLKEKSDQGK